MADSPDPPPPPTKDGLLDLFRRVVPTEYFNALANRGDGQPTDAFALFRGLARLFEALVDKGTRSAQARYYLPSSIQTDLPASSARPASGDVVLRRVAAMNGALVVDAGRMRLRGPGSRRYVNAERVVWNPGDKAPRTVRFVCEVAGFVGNLDFVADSNGQLGLDLIEIDDQDFGRAAAGGTIVAVSPEFSVITDSGVPDLFAPGDVGLYVAINAATNAANVGTLRRVIGFDWPAVETPVGSGRYPRRVFLDDVERRNTVEALQDDGGMFTDFYAEASDELGTDDVPLFPASGTVGDAFLFGFSAPFAGVEIRFDTPGEGDWAVAWEYWDGASWQPLANVNDPTNGFRPAQDTFYDITWDIPLDWASQLSPTGSGIPLFYVRARLDTVTTYTVQPLGGRVVVFSREPLVPEAASVTWALRDFQADAMGLELVSVQAFVGGRDDDLYLLGDERGIYRQANEPDDVFRDRAARLADVVSPVAIQRAINRSLRPLGLSGDVMDVTIDTTVDESLVGAGFTGLFFDVETSFAPDQVAAFDLYAPGDLYPQDPWLVLQSAEEAYGWFLVLLPYLGQGDFGTFFDEGPLYFDETVEVFYGPSFDGWLDGFPATGYPTYSAIHSLLTPIRAGGVGFTMIRRESLTVPGVC